MRLKKGFIRHKVGEEYMAVATSEASKDFHGLIRNNETADYLFELLMNETSEEELVDNMCKRYDADRKQIEADVHELLECLKKTGFLEK